MKRKALTSRLEDFGIGSSSRAFVIAEIGVNHDGRLDRALELVSAAKKAGADAVKFQTFKAERLVSGDASQAAYQRRNTGRRETQLEMLKRLELTNDEFLKISNYCKKLGILFLSTPFDFDSADFLHEIGMPIFKISSGDLTNIPFISHVAAFARPMIISTGMANLSEISLAAKTISSKNASYAILHCTSSYPADYNDINLLAMNILRKKFRAIVGYSDHSEGIEVAIAAAALGAKIIEKHFTLDRRLPGPDHRASIEAGELEEMIRAVRNVCLALGTPVKKPCAAELDVMKVARKSIFSACEIRKGETIQMRMLDFRRPGTGILPSLASKMIGMRAKKDISAGKMLKWSEVTQD